MTPSKNIEIKVRLRDRPRVEVALQRLGARDAGPETQHDIFYRAANGRLKLRDSSRDGAMLIQYQRADAAAVRDSNYRLAAVTDLDALRAVLDDALGRSGEVHKRRHLWWLDNVRVHLDDVEGLGAFLELEAIVDPAHPEDACRKRVEELLDCFGVASADRAAIAYVDLLDARPPR
jgi:predicted adenylyl cyclase CyaB